MAQARQSVLEMSGMCEPGFKGLSRVLLWVPMPEIFGSRGVYMLQAEYLLDGSISKRTRDLEWRLKEYVGHTGTMLVLRLVHACKLRAEATLLMIPGSIIEASSWPEGKWRSNGA